MANNIIIVDRAPNWWDNYSPLLGAKYVQKLNIYILGAKCMW